MEEKKWLEICSELFLFLKDSPYVIKGLENKNERCCICGMTRAPIFKEYGSVKICEECETNKVNQLSEAAGLLYLSYQKFSGMFQVYFRYPNLSFSRQNMDNIKTEDFPGESINELIKITDEADRNFSLEIAKGIPYCLLEELYVRAFAVQFFKGWRDRKMHYKRKEKKKLKEKKHQEQTSFDLRNQNLNTRFKRQNGDSNAAEKKVELSSPEEFVQYMCQNWNEIEKKKQEDLDGFWTNAITRIYLKQVGREEQYIVRQTELKNGF